MPDIPIMSERKAAHLWLKTKKIIRKIIDSVSTDSLDENSFIVSDQNIV